MHSAVDNCDNRARNFAALSKRRFTARASLGQSIPAVGLAAAYPVARRLDAHWSGVKRDDGNQKLDTRVQVSSAPTADSGTLEVNISVVPKVNCSLSAGLGLWSHSAPRPPEVALLVERSTCGYVITPAILMSACAAPNAGLVSV
ncbi:hypothetical protein HJFPF1_11334 [Paramyrothecium foliicola]|nr:hypothetical protein HJFPF1_11334 [Paramyrothecium foliicola]